MADENKEIVIGGVNCVNFDAVLKWFLTEIWDLSLKIGCSNGVVARRAIASGALAVVAFIALQLTSADFTIPIAVTIVIGLIVGVVVFSVVTLTLCRYRHMTDREYATDVERLVRLKLVGRRVAVARKMLQMITPLTISFVEAGDVDTVSAVMLKCFGASNKYEKKIRLNNTMEFAIAFTAIANLMGRMKDSTTEDDVEFIAKTMADVAQNPAVFKHAMKHYGVYKYCEKQHVYSIIKKMVRPMTKEQIIENWRRWKDNEHWRQEYEAKKAAEAAADQ